MSLPVCPCGSGHALVQCCGLYHNGLAAPTAEALMRSRYSAYALGLIDYLVRTTLPAQQKRLDLDAITAWSLNSSWQGLTVEDSTLLPGNPAHAYVTFTACWGEGEQTHSHRERSAFVAHDGRWYFIDPTVDMKLGRNDTCPCASGLKFKKCCAAFM